MLTCITFLQAADHIKDLYIRSVAMPQRDTSWGHNTAGCKYRCGYFMVGPQSTSPAVADHALSTVNKPPISIAEDDSGNLKES